MRCVDLCCLAIAHDGLARGRTLPGYSVVARALAHRCTAPARIRPAWSRAPISLARTTELGAFRAGRGFPAIPDCWPSAGRVEDERLGLVQGAFLLVGKDVAHAQLAHALLPWVPGSDDVTSTTSNSLRTCPAPTAGDRWLAQYHTPGVAQLRSRRHRRQRCGRKSCHSHGQPHTGWPLTSKVRGKTHTASRFPQPALAVGRPDLAALAPRPQPQLRRLVPLQLRRGLRVLTRPVAYPRRFTCSD